MFCNVGLSPSGFRVQNIICTTNIRLVCMCVYSPIYLWHTQQMITVPTHAAMSAVASEHTNQLAKHAVCAQCRQVLSAELILIAEQSVGLARIYQTEMLFLAFVVLDDRSEVLDLGSSGVTRRVGEGGGGPPRVTPCRG